jgi:prolipoprotein diacylglyceryltransferase
MDIVSGRTAPFGTADGGQVCHGSALVPGAFQPTFLYECIWDVALGLALIWIDRRLRLGRGNVAALYVMGYTCGRVWIEALREDHANHILGVRLNIWTCLVVFVLGLIYFWRHGRFRAEREPGPYPGRDDPGGGEVPADERPDGAVAEAARDGDPSRPS